MADDKKAQDQELTADELEQEEGEELPDREAMSLINANAAAPVAGPRRIERGEPSADGSPLRVRDEEEGEGDDPMSTHDHLTPEELAAQEADLLPDREAMSLIDPSSALAYGSTGIPGTETTP